jgi:putative transposase
LASFLQQASDVREYKRALAVQLAEQGVDYALIKQSLQVSGPFISKWRRIYRQQGVEGFRMGYKGSKGHLTAHQRVETVAWLKSLSRWDVGRLQVYLEDSYGVVYQSLQSYYDLLHAAGLSWKKSQPKSPQKTMP